MLKHSNLLKEAGQVIKGIRSLLNLKTLNYREDSREAEFKKPKPGRVNALISRFETGTSSKSKKRSSSSDSDKEVQKRSIGQYVQRDIRASLQMEKMDSVDSGKIRNRSRSRSSSDERRKRAVASVVVVKGSRSRSRSSSDERRLKAAALVGAKIRSRSRSREARNHPNQRKKTNS